MSNKLLKVKVNVCFYQCFSITTNYLWGKLSKIDQHYKYKNEEINLFQKKIKISLIVWIFKWSLGLPYKWIYEYKDGFIFFMFIMWPELKSLDNHQTKLSEAFIYCIHFTLNFCDFRFIPFPRQIYLDSIMLISKLNNGSFLRSIQPFSA